jgi:probable rRNA maturation factor
MPRSIIGNQLQLNRAMITIDPSSTMQAETPAKSTLTRFLNRAREAVGITGEVDVFLTTDAEIKTLNRQFRHKNKATDVLSFPAPEEIFSQHAGDLAISLDTAAKQASSFGHSLGDEVRVLMLHGLLHLSGMDHETDKGEMAAHEIELRTELKLPSSLIERVTSHARKATPPHKSVIPTAARSAKRRDLLLSSKSAPAKRRTR